MQAARIVVISWFIFVSFWLSVPAAKAATRRVPQDHATIQAAVTAAAVGDTILVSSGTYQENITLNKGVTLQATSYDQANPRNNTVIIDGGGGVAAITLPQGISGNPKVTGFHIRNAGSLILSRSIFTVEYSFFNGSAAGDDLMEYEKGGGGMNRFNIYDGANDDAIDMDNQVNDVTVEGNTLLNSSQDGTEVRLQDDVITATADNPDGIVDYLFRNNRYEGNGKGSSGDGLQIIDYSTDTKRRFTIEKNLFLNNIKGSALGLMCCEVTVEDYTTNSFANIREEIRVFNNTIVGNKYGITGGDNMLVINNIVANSAVTGLAKIDTASRIDHNLLFGNATNLSGVTATNSLTVDPRLDANYHLQSTSPAINAGLATYVWTSISGASRGLSIPTSQYTGSAPDMGWKESGAVSPTNTPTLPPSPTVSVAPTATIPPGNTRFAITLYLHGIGSGGDNVSSTGIGNTNPLHPQRSVSLELFDTSNQSAGVKQGSVLFNASDGKFHGIVDGGNLPSGVYTAKIKVPQYLVKYTSGILTVIAGQANSLPILRLVTGDIDNDNKLTTTRIGGRPSDYELLLDCFSDLLPARNCADQNKKLMADLTDDGKVNQFDYNLFLRELSVQGGDGEVTPEPTEPQPTHPPTVIPSPTLPPTVTPTVTIGPTLPPGEVVGYGKNTVGGTGGTVTNVSTLAALRSCVAATGKRICKVTGSGIFDGAGGTVTIEKPNITIDGSGSSVIFKDVWIQVRTSEVILRHLRVRTGDLNVFAQDADAISINGGTGVGISNIVVDHVEAIWGPDVCFTILNNVSNVTVQHSIIGVGLTKSAHPESLDDIDGHNLSFNISGLSATAWPKRITVYRNLMLNAQGRHTRSMGSEAVDIINNVYYNYDEAPQGNPRSLNFVGNILRWGPAPQAAGLGDPEKYIYKPDTSGDFPTLFTNTVYEANNVADGFTGAIRGTPATVYRTSPALSYSVTPESTTGLLDRILAESGPHPRDTLTNQWISETRNKTGTYFNGDDYPAPNPHWP